MPCKTFELDAGKTVLHVFPDGFSAYWVRAVSDTTATATAWFKYN